MDGSPVRVALHCHSTLSDGTLSPEALAEAVAAQGARYAALTDHDTVGGLRVFRSTLARSGVGVIDGIEVGVVHGKRELHLVAYGIDSGDAALASLLAGIRRGPPSCPDAIRALHAAGGVVFLAHPLSYGLPVDQVEPLVRELQPLGLDGLEALYAGYTTIEVNNLTAMARRCGLAVSAGCDYHGPGGQGPTSAVMEIDRDRWEDFRARLLGAAAARQQGPRAPQTPARPEGRRPRPAGFAARIVFPTAIAVALFAGAIFGVVIPGFERSLLDRKKEMIRELTNSAVSILREYAAEESAGRLTLPQAQEAAAARVRDLRYGSEGKDYFWITDMRPVMIMHPWRTDLVGTDVTDYADANGVRVFVEFVNAVRGTTEGYVEYLWQWKDDSHRIVPKLSFVKRFEPWDWVVGTGIYIEDVNAEIRVITGRLARLSALIAALVALLLLYVAQQGLAIERRRRRAEEGLRESHERYQALVEASTEGMLVVVGSTCTYANRTFQDMVDFTVEELSLLEVGELLRAHTGGEARLCRFLDTVTGDRTRMEPASCECLVMGRGGRSVDALLTGSRFDVGGREAAIVTVKDLAARRRAQAGGEGGPTRGLWQVAPVGMARATAGRRAMLIEANPEARRILGLPAEVDLAATNLYTQLTDPRAAAAIQETLAAGRAVRAMEIRLRADGAAAVGGGASGHPVERVVLLTAVPEDDPDGEARQVDLLLEDATEHHRALDRERSLAEELETSALRLSGPVSGLAREVPTCDLETSIREAVALMGRADRDALMVTTAGGEPVGIVTDHDIRERLVGAALDPARPVREIMSAPVARLDAAATLAEAVLAMQSRGHGHLAVADTAGRVLGVLSSRDLLRHHRESPTVLAREIAAAKTRDDLRSCRERFVALARRAAAGAPARVVGRTYALLSDLLVRRLVDLGVARLGPAPFPFAFVALGSEGRREQVPGSDQDNALVWDGPDDAATVAWFGALAQEVCAALDALGVPFCAGEVMARNPRWCVPLSTWTRYFRGWILEPEPQEILEFSIFFDLRAVAGEASLVTRLAATIREYVTENPAFVHHLARDTVQRRLPASRANAVDLKEAMTPLTSFARVYALRHGVDATHTRDRLDELRRLGVLSPEAHETIGGAHALLTRLRLTHGPRARVEPSSLGREEEAALRSAVAELGVLQKRLAFDFPGAAV